MYSNMQIGFMLQIDSKESWGWGQGFEYWGKT